MDGSVLDAETKNQVDMKKWEYKAVTDWQEFYLLGQQGWELVTISYRDLRAETAYFKREIPPESVKEVKEILEELGTTPAMPEGIDREEMKFNLAMLIDGTELTYVGTKIVRAKPMTDGDFNVVFKNMAQKGKMDNPGYLVIYEDGYRSWSPKEVFERCYRRITDAEKKLI